VKSYYNTNIPDTLQLSRNFTNSLHAQPPLLAKTGNIPCDLGGAYSPPYQGGVGGG